MPECEILREEYDGDNNTAVVEFIAKLKHKATGSSTQFKETSTFERSPDTGAWLYRDGVIEGSNNETAPVIQV